MHWVPSTRHSLPSSSPLDGSSCTWTWWLPNPMGRSTPSNRKLPWKGKSTQYNGRGLANTRALLSNPGATFNTVQRPRCRASRQHLSLFGSLGLPATSSWDCDHLYM